MSILEWIAGIILVVYALNGLRRGLVRTVFATFTIVVSIAVAVNISPYVSRSLQHTAIFETVNDYIGTTLFSGEETDTERIAGQTEAIQALPLPSSVKDALLENNNNEIYNAFGITEFKDYVANYLTCLIMNALSFIIIFLAAVILLKIIAACLDIISYLPVLHSLNKIGGFLFGAINGFVILWIVCIAATIFSGTEIGGYIYGGINDSMFLRLIYNHNYLLTVVSNLKYLIV